MHWNNHFLAKNMDHEDHAIMKSLFGILIVLPGLIGLPVFADISPAACEDIVAAEPAPKPPPKPDEEEPDCE
jgi:MinD-like ATPase involved in chromosome partitioning or flagellar assembly